MRRWQEVRAEAVARGAVTEEGLAAARQATDERIRAYRLTELRRRQALTQVEVAEIMGVKQPWISQIERGDLAHVELDTLRAYVSALGGQLKVVADFGEDQLVIAA
jgi:predicted XRE-type DNA-binding protein